MQPFHKRQNHEIIFEKKKYSFILIDYSHLVFDETELRTRIDLKNFVLNDSF